MRVLFTSNPGLGHVHPMVPLAQALAHRGHEVRRAVAAEANAAQGAAAGAALTLAPDEASADAIAGALGAPPPRARLRRSGRPDQRRDRDYARTR